jgi:heme oxygenase
MTTIKELTWEHHKNAERQEFVKVLMSGSIDPKLYATFLFNQHPCYNILETVAMSHGLLDGIFEVKRASRIHADFMELWTEKEQPIILDSTNRYMQHIKSIMDDPHKIMSHIYVRHMGDLSGGQMIKKKIPGAGTMYEFDGEIATLKDSIRAKLDDNMADEAKICFEFATDTFKELMEIEIK